MIDVRVLRELYDHHERRGARVAGMMREDTGRTVRFVNEGAGEGLVLHSTLDEGSADEAIAGEILRFRGAAQDVEWKLHDYDAPPDLRRRLLEHGFEAGPDEVLVAFDLSQPPPPVAGGIETRLLEDPAEFDVVHRVRLAAFGESRPWQVEALGEEHRRDPNALRVHVAYVDGEPAAAGWSRLGPHTPFATLWAGGTVPKHRRRGAYRTLVSARLAEARDRGYHHALVDAGPLSLPILERLGFVAVARMTPMLWRAR